MDINKFWQEKIYQNILDILFPIRCLSCGKLDFWICDDCINNLPEKTEQFCPCCESMQTPGGKTCFSCKPHFPLAGIFAATSYSEKLVTNAVHNYKYRVISDLHIPLGKILTRAICHSPLPLPDLIVPVPLHPRRLRWRGFNQSAFLARQLAGNMATGLTIPVDEKILVRIRPTLPQMQIKNYASRKKNIRNAFFAAESKLNGKTVLLVDDIATTGSTLSECAEVLKKAGAKEVYAVVIARQEIKKHSA
jgi:ComF family protein